jgi:hypothetical protein
MSKTSVALAGIAGASVRGVRVAISGSGEASTAAP